MDRYLLKNIIIIILVLVNGFLLGSLSMRYWSAAKAQDQMEEQLVALFASDGMELDPDIISQDAPPSSLSLSRDLDREQAAAAFFLGSDMAQGDQSGDTYTYSSKLGAARFRSNGGFDIVGTLSDADGEELCRRFCKDFPTASRFLSWMRVEAAAPLPSASMASSPFITAQLLSPLTKGSF